MYVCLFVCFFGGLSSHSRIFSLIWRRHHYWLKASNFALCSTLLAIEQWRFFSVPHVLWHGASFYVMVSEDSWHSHLLLSVKRWSCHCFLRLRSIAAGFRTPNLSLERTNALTHCATARFKGMNIIFFYVRYVYYSMYVRSVYIRAH